METQVGEKEGARDCRGKPEWLWLAEPSFLTQSQRLGTDSVPGAVLRWSVHALMRSLQKPEK